MGLMLAPAHNDNLPPEALADRAYVSDLLDRHCRACDRECELKALVARPAPLGAICRITHI